MLETIRVATYAVVVPAFLFSLYCAVAAIVSRIEDKPNDRDRFTAALDATTDDLRVDLTEELRKAA